MISLFVSHYIRSSSLRVSKFLLKAHIKDSLQPNVILAIPQSELLFLETLCALVFLSSSNDTEPGAGLLPGPDFAFSLLRSVSHGAGFRAVVGQAPCTDGFFCGRPVEGTGRA